jgi:hypothetical protein
MQTLTAPHYPAAMADSGWSDWIGDPLADGWLGVDTDALPGRLFVHFQPDPDGRLRPVDLVLLGDGEPLTGAHLRNLPVHRLEAEANDLLADALRPAENSEAVPDVHKTLEGLFRDLGKAWSARHHRKAEHEGRAQREPVRRPVGKERPDEFYRTVAAAYLEAVRAGKAPGRVIADEATASPRTVQGWIAEARRRGFLPPARHGAAG